MTKRTTLEDVAKLAGVGKVTVSYVLNGRADEARISPKTRDKILGAARDLDYRPNALARMLHQKRTDTFAVVFQYADYFGASSTFISELLRGVCDSCVANGLDVLMHTKPAMDPIAEADALSDGRVDGALVLRDSGDEALSVLIKRRFPVVLFFCRPDDETVPFVDLDNFMGGQLATQHLIDLGHRRIATIRGGIGSVASNHRHAGYRHALESNGIPYDDSLVIRFQPDEAPMPQIHALLRKADQPTAFFAWSDDDAIIAMRAVSEFGLSIPGDVSIVGFDSLAVCDQTTPPLTSIRQPVAQMARKATQVLVDIVNGAPVSEAHRIVYPPSLDHRGSTSTLSEKLRNRSL